MESCCFPSRVVTFDHFTLAKQRAARYLISGSKIQLLFKLPADSFQATAQIKPVPTPFPTTSFPYKAPASSFFLNFYIVL